MYWILILAFVASFNQEPKVEWNLKEYDFGEIEYKKFHYATFEMKNLSDKAIYIDNVRTACGCTSVDWDYEAIPAGATTEIKVEYDAKDKGEFYRWLRVYISNQKKPEKLYITGTVVGF